MAEDGEGIVDSFLRRFRPKSKSPEAHAFAAEAALNLPHQLGGTKLPGEDATELHPDDAAAMAEHDSRMQRRNDFEAQAILNNLEARKGLSAGVATPSTTTTPEPTENT